MTIGQLARESGVSTETLRYYETLKLVEPVGRTSSGYRLYDSSSAARVAFIKRSKSLGFQLSEIQSLLELHKSDDSTAQHMLDLTEIKIDKAQKDINDLISMKKTLEDLVTECPGGDLSLKDCPIFNHFYFNKDSMKGKNS